MTCLVDCCPCTCPPPGLPLPQEFGHALVPADWPVNPGLARWVQVQRRRWQGRQGTPLTPGQESRLLSCGWVLAAVPLRLLCGVLDCMHA